jgi:protein-L-isoaspartate(D-aspartate) O-methyltransferase
MNIELARTNMISQQLRTCDVNNEAILALIRNTPREAFVPEHLRYLAFSDIPIAIHHDQVMMTPYIEATMLQALSAKPTDSILEIGTGTGYITALLAKLSHKVYTIDIFPDFTMNAQSKLRSLSINNVDYFTADASQGWGKNAPYDVIAITGSMPTLPKIFKESLAIGGRLFVVLGSSPVMRATLITRDSEQLYSTKILFETDLKPLINPSAIEPFSFY